MEKKRAVAYIRVSTASDAQLHSYEFQEQYWKEEFEKKQNEILVGIYADRGISGKCIEKRPQFLKMMDDAREHKFDIIYCKSVSRFGRNTTQLLEAVRELRDIGVEVVFEEGNIRTFNAGSELFLTIAATIAENDLKTDSERMRWSIHHRYENGFISVGTGLYGYRMTKNNELIIQPEEAAIVKFVFNEYLAGKGSVTIAKELNEAGIKTENGRAWGSVRILSMLSNEKYKGDAMMGKGIYVGGKAVDNMDGSKGPTYYIEDSHEGIVSKEDWQQVHNMIKNRSEKCGNTYKTYPFSKLIECGECGGRYHHKVNNCDKKWRSDFWMCLTQNRNGIKACNNTRIKDEVLKEKFKEAYNEFIEKRPQGEEIIAMQEIKAELMGEEKALAELYLQHLISEEDFRREHRDIKTKIQDISEKINDRRYRNVREVDMQPMTDFDEDKVNKFIKKVTITHNVVTFEFYNGAKIIRGYTNGKPGNKKGWNKKEDK